MFVPILMQLFSQNKELCSESKMVEKSISRKYKMLLYHDLLLYYSQTIVPVFVISV